MKYSLIVYNNINKVYKNIYEVYGLESILGNNYNLKSILEFTSKYENDESLINYLISQNLLPSIYQGSKVGIGEYKNGKLVIRHPHVVYEEYSKFLEPSVLKYYYEKGLTNPGFFIPFAEKLCYTFENINNNSKTLKRQMINLNLMKNYVKAYKGGYYSNSLQFDFEKKINDFYKFYTTNKKGELDFTQYTKLLMNIIDFEEKKKVKQTNKKGRKEEIAKVYDITPDEDKSLVLDDYEAEMNYFEQMEIENIDEEKEKQEIMEMIDYYSTLLDNGNLTDEDRLAYQDKIDELETKLGRKR